MPFDRIIYAEDCTECGQSVCGRFGEKLRLCPACKRHRAAKRRMATLAELPSAEEWEHLRPFLDTLTYRQRRVIERCYGFDGNPGWSLDQIGKMFNLTRERVRQIRNEAIQHLRLREAPWPQ